jgi:hypothetical protein
MDDLKTTIMRTENLTSSEADEMITRARAELYLRLEDSSEGSAYDICEDWFGLEPDYVMDLI